MSLMAALLFFWFASFELWVVVLPKVKFAKGLGNP
jgi:hypothetical protein